MAEASGGVPRVSPLFILWGGELASRIGESFFQIALLWYLLELTGNTATTGLLTMLTYLPAFVVGLWAGVVVDRLEYRRVLLLSNVARVALAAALPLLYMAGVLPLAGIGVLGFLISSASAFFNPARDAIIPLLAKRGGISGVRLVKANSLVQSAWQFSIVVGPFLAAAMLPFFPTVYLFFAVALAFAISLAVLLGLGFQPLTEPTGEAPPGNFLREFREGFGYLFRERRVFWIWVITVCNNFFLMGPVFVGIPHYVKSHLGGGGQDYALIEGIYAGGMIVSTWLIARYGARFNPLRVLFLALIYDGFTYIPLLWVTSVEGTVLTILIHSLGIPAITISRITALHHMVPQHMQGRVFSYFHLAVAGMTAISLGVVGMVLLVLPANQLFLVIGLLAGSCGIVGLCIPSLWGNPMTQK